VDEEAIEEVKALLAVARKRQVNFGLCLGSDPEDTVLVLHRMKSPDVLARQAKKEGSTNKVAQGSIEVQGKVVQLSCTDDPPAGTAKRLKRFLATVAKMKFAVRLVDASGAVLDEDLDDDDAQAASEAGASAQDQPGAEDDTGALQARLQAALDRLAPRIAQARAANEKAGPVLDKLTAEVQAAGAAGDGGAAKQRLEQIVAVLGKVLPQDAQADKAPISIVALGKARHEWIATREKVFADLARLKRQIEIDYADMPEAAAAVTGALARLDRLIADLNMALHDDLDEVLNADPAERPAKSVKARATMAAFAKLLKSDPIFKELDGNDILSDVAITAPLASRLSQINAALG
jgi:hypothetical protein